MQCIYNFLYGKKVLLIIKSHQSLIKSGLYCIAHTPSNLANLHRFRQNTKSYNTVVTGNLRTAKLKRSRN